MEKHYLAGLLCLLLCVVGTPLHAVTRIVTTVADLQAVVSDDDVQLMSDLDLSNEVWNPICHDPATPYVGTFEGNGHVIILPKRFHGSHTLGLFGYIGTNGQVRQLGLVSGHATQTASQMGIQAGSRRRVGSLAGMNSGLIDECWSMAMIANSGTMVGGLVGEQTASGRIENCYFTGLILNATDTIGGLVGRNAGSISNSWVAGYAKNGFAIVGADEAGTYTECSYDRKLYYQMPGAQSDGIVAKDFSIEQYPILPIFAGHDAALLSTIGIPVDTVSISPVNHLNDLTEDFNLTNLYGEQWRVEALQDWIVVGANVLEVTRPCTETDVIVNIDLGGYVRPLYLRPRRLEDFSAGIFTGYDTVLLCADDKETVNTHLQSTLASDGWVYGDYHYRVLLDSIDPLRGDVISTTELLSDTDSQGYLSWLASYVLPTQTDGLFALRREARDERCVDSWMPSKGQLLFHVAAPFYAGSIQSETDTIYGLPAVVSVQNEVLATGGHGDITYSFYQNGILCQTGSSPSLTDWSITRPGKYAFTRKAMDQICYPNADTDSEGIFTVVVCDTIHPGQILNAVDTLVFCNPDEAQKTILQATTPTGGNGNYLYQWFLISNYTEQVIIGAEGKDLDLALLPTFAYDTEYTFIRKVKDDSRFTSFKQSEGAKTVRIRPQLNAGSIPSETLPQLCWAFDENGSQYVTISEQTPATGEDLSYRWVRTDGQTEQEIAQTKDLNYEFPASDVQTGAAFTYYRYVQTADCGWVRSEGMVKQTYARGTREEISIQVCSSDMPYTFIYGSDNSHVFTYDGEQFAFSGIAENGCVADTVLTCHVLTVPSISKADNGFVCQDNDQIPLYFYLNTGDASFFRITYSPDLAAYMGVTDTTGVLNEPEEDLYTIILRNVPPLGTGDFYLQIAVGIDEQSCMSRAISMDLEIALGGYVHQKYNRVLFVDNNPANGEIQGDKLRFCTYQWYRNGIPEEGQNGQYYQESGAMLQGTYYVYLTDTIHGVTYRSCDIVMPQEESASVSQQIAVYPIPAIPNRMVSVSGIEQWCGDDADARNICATILNSLGEIVAIQNLSVANSSFMAPTQPGIYYLKLDNGVRMQVIKIMVE